KSQGDRIKGTRHRKRNNVAVLFEQYLRRLCYFPSRTDTDAVFIQSPGLRMSRVQRIRQHPDLRRRPDHTGQYAFTLGGSNSPMGETRIQMVEGPDDKGRKKDRYPYNQAFQ